MTEMAPNRRAVALRGRRLEYFTIAWNSLEGLIAVAAGVTAGSISLVGFGVDSFIEVTSGSALLWRMSMDADVESRERVERLTLRIVGCCFLALAGYVAWEAVGDLASRRAPAHSPVGVALALVSLAVMPVLARAKRRVGQTLGSGAMQADATQTQLCAYLSAILLGGLLLNVFWDLWWADPLAGLLMVPIIGREGIGALRGEGCECD